MFVALSEVDLRFIYEHLSGGTCPICGVRHARSEAPYMPVSERSLTFASNQKRALLVYDEPSEFDFRIELAHSMFIPCVDCLSRIRGFFNLNRDDNFIPRDRFPDLHTLGAFRRAFCGGGASGPKLVAQGKWALDEPDLKMAIRILQTDDWHTYAPYNFWHNSSTLHYSSCFDDEFWDGSDLLNISSGLLRYKIDYRKVDWAFLAHFVWEMSHDKPPDEYQPYRIGVIEEEVLFSFRKDMRHYIIGFGVLDDSFEFSWNTLKSSRRLFSADRNYINTYDDYYTVPQLYQLRKTLPQTFKGLDIYARIGCPTYDNSQGRFVYAGENI